MSRSQLKNIESRMDEIRGQILRGTNRELAELEQQVQRIVRQQNRFYFAEMANKIIGKQRTPTSLAEFGTTWHRLKDKTLKKKQQQGTGGPNQPNFFKDSGEMRGQLRTLDNVGVTSIYSSLGATRPEAEIRVKTSRGKEVTGVTAVQGINLRNLQAQLIIWPLGSSFESRKLGDPSTAFDIHDTDLARKMVNPRGRPRSFREEFFQWWVQRHLPNRIEKGLPS